MKAKTYILKILSARVPDRQHGLAVFFLRAGPGSSTEVSEENSRKDMARAGQSVIRSTEKYRDRTRQSNCMEYYRAHSKRDVHAYDMEAYKVNGRTGKGEGAAKIIPKNGVMRGTRKRKERRERQKGTRKQEKKNKHSRNPRKQEARKPGAVAEMRFGSR